MSGWILLQNVEAEKRIHMSFHTLSAIDCLIFMKSEVVYDRTGKK